MAGRRPKPTVSKLLAGNPGKRKLTPENEPQFSGIPTCPKHLTKGAKTEWKRLAPQLTASGLLTSVDRAALAAYCSAWSRWVDAEESIAKFGLVIKSPKSGYPVANPFVGISNTAIEIMRKFLVEFGMTPASRSRIHVNSDGSSTDDAFQSFMRGIGAMEEDTDPTNDEIETAELLDTSE